MVSPGRGFPPGLSFVAPTTKTCRWEPRLAMGFEFGKRTCKPNSVVCGHSSRRRVAADVHQRPTRRFRPLHGAALRRRAGTVRESCSKLALPSLFGLAPCGVYLAPGVTAGAVRSYRTISPLPRRWSCRNGERTRQAGPTRVLRFQGGPWPEGQGVAEAVSFLWHWPSMSLDAHVPDVIRHTALRSSDFPPPADLACARPPAATARSSCQGLVYRGSGSRTGYARNALIRRCFERARLQSCRKCRIIIVGFSP